MIIEIKGIYGEIFFIFDFYNEDKEEFESFHEDIQLNFNSNL
jgi:hypothetical protein